MRAINTIDTHTAGGPTRIITGGLPPLRGSTVADKMRCFEKEFDPLRRILMQEPRGHADMFGAVLTEPSSSDASLGAFFLTARGYLATCVHSSIGVAAAGVATGFIRTASRDSTSGIGMETPAGVVTLSPAFDQDALVGISVRTAPAFVWTEARVKLVDGSRLNVSGAFSGTGIALVDVKELTPASDHGPSITGERIPSLAQKGVEVLKALGDSAAIAHPSWDEAKPLELLMFWEDLGSHRYRDLVVNERGGVDRSPCGAAVGAKVADEVRGGRLGVGERITVESVLGTRLRGQAARTTTVGSYPGVIPEIQGRAHITGFHNFVVEPQDSLGGFLVF